MNAHFKHSKKKRGWQGVFVKNGVTLSERLDNIYSFPPPQCVLRSFSGEVPSARRSPQNSKLSVGISIYNKHVIGFFSRTIWIRNIIRRLIRLPTDKRLIPESNEDQSKG